jgi:hypothetical protein
VSNPASLGSGDRREVFPDTITKEQINEVLDEVLPPWVRGNKIYGDLTASVNKISWTHTEYEQVSFVETKVDGVGKGITVTFKDAACPKQKVQQ